jgi:hypothetical protein
MECKRSLAMVFTFLVAIVGVVWVAGEAHAAATIVVQNADGPGEGFNDNTPWTPTGGNPATTVGQARLNAFQYAADLWGAGLTSVPTIVVEAEMNSLPCVQNSGVLGFAGPASAYRVFLNQPLADTWYPIALANAIAGTDLNPNPTTGIEIGAEFNSNIDGNPGCLQGAEWYYGYDGNPQSGQIDFVTVVMHEIAHGLGFLTFVDLATGEKLLGSDDAYMVHLNRAGVTPGDYPDMNDAQRVSASKADPALRWTGPMTTLTHPTIPVTAGTNAQYVRVHAPFQQQPGSSVSHFSTSVTPSEVMEPAYTGADHDPSLAFSLMDDLGWTVDPAYLPSAPVAFAMVVATPVEVGIEIRWNMSADEPIDGFNVYRQREDQAFEIRVNVSGPIGVTERSYTDADVEPGATYRYSVAVIMPDGTERRSPSIKASVGEYVTHLDQNTPNPFNPSTQIGYRIADDQRVRVAIYDVSGALVRTLVDAPQQAGAYTVTWGGANDEGMPVSSGVYFYRLEAGKLTQTRRMVLLK